MNILRVLLLCVGLGAPLLPSAVNAQDSSTLFQSGSEAFQQQDYLSALAKFQAARRIGMDGPAIHYNIAVCHFKLGDYAQAESEFRVIANRFNSIRELAEYNRGLSLMQLNKPEEARAAFQLARTSDDETIARLANAMLAGIAPEEPPSATPSTWLKLVDLNFGHDDNVALIEESSLPAGQSTESPLTEIFAFLSGPLGRGSKYRFDASGYIVDYSDAGQFDQSAVRLATAYKWTTQNWQLEAGPHYNYSTLNGNALEQHIGASLDLRRPLSSRSSFAIRLIHDEVDDLDSRFSFIHGSRDQIRLSHELRGERSRLMLDYQFENNDRADASVSPSRNRVSIRYRRESIGRWNGELQYSYRLSQYDDLIVPRDETLSQLGVIATRELSSGWRLTTQYWSSDNDSDAPQFSYRRNRLSIGLSRLF